MTDRAATHDHSDGPVVVRVTIEPGNRHRAAPKRAKLRGHLKAVIATAAAALLAGAAVGVAASLGSNPRTPPIQAHSPLAHDAGPAGVAAAYRYPLACLSVTIAAADPAYAAARLDRASPCWRFGAYGAVIFHRVAGAWAVLPATSGANCATSSIPAVVRAQLGVRCSR
jgi:hypothetical protein